MDQPSRGSSFGQRPVDALELITGRLADVLVRVVDQRFDQRPRDLLPIRRRSADIAHLTWTKPSRSMSTVPGTVMFGR
jgi:hypothetical protein